MDNVRGSEWLVFMTMMVHLIMTPFTKVEESFNTQAVHDILHLRHNITQYDNLQFPGVVPRTFAGPLYLSVIMSPVFALMRLFNVQKIWLLFTMRLVLGSSVILPFLGFCRALSNQLGTTTADCLRVIVASQFHFLFYASRPLPNTFALALVLLAFKAVIDRDFRWSTRYAATAVVLFRFELVLLFAPLYLWLFVGGGARVFAVIREGVLTAAVVLAITVPIDSLLWSRTLWPEGEVIWFNVILNRSHEYGVMPITWYFTSALPRALLTSSALIPIGLLFERRSRPLFIITIAFVALYSFLPHKELRFIIYAIPLLNVPAACAFARFWNNRHKTWWHRLLAYGVAGHIVANAMLTFMFLYASARNYPGGDALAHLQHTHRYNRNEPRSLHIDEFCAQSGINRFVQIYDAWEYNKTENMSANQLARFDFLLLGAPSADDIRANHRVNFSTTHRELFAVESFHRIGWSRIKKFPYYFPSIKFKEKVLALKKLDF